MLYLLYRYPLSQLLPDLPEDLRKDVLELLKFLDEVAYYFFSNLYADVAALPIVAAVTGRIFLREGGTIERETAKHFISSVIPYLVLREGDEVFRPIPFSELREEEYQAYVWETFTGSMLE